ncbi:MAG: efflux RND transporter periplasmic adaptor subunit [Chloroflexi bacterium]|nr:efflux RND transporter periplasmic adaptor subunit [Chloroflexota bacterium]
MDFLKNKKIRNWGIAVVIVIVAVMVGQSFFSANNANAAVATEAKVMTLHVAETIEASGSLDAQPFARLTWKTGGVVKAVNVKPGDFVKADAILLTLEPASTSAAIVSAQADLVTAQKNLEDLLNSNIDLAQSVIDLKTAKESYEDAADYLEYLQNDKKIPLTETKLILHRTPMGYQYEYKTRSFKGPATQDMLTEAQNDLALKQAKYEEVQRTYDRLKDGPNAQDVLAAQARVDAAQATVNSLSIIAPFDGQVLSVDHRVGDVVDTGELSVNIADMDHLYVETQVDESDIANVKLGNQAEVTLDAVAGIQLTGKVAAINPVGETVGGLVKYNVRIDLDKVAEGTFLPLGSTANVVIKIKDVEATLAVPITAIQNDSEGEFVWAVRNGETVRVNVLGGAIVGELVAVTGDLQEGETLQIVHESSFAAPNPFGGSR